MSCGGGIMWGSCVTFTAHFTDPLLLTDADRHETIWAEVAEMC